MNKKNLTRALTRIRSLWQNLSGDSSNETGALRPGQISILRRTLADCINETGGEVSARQRAARLGQMYLGLNETGRRDFLLVLAALKPNQEQIRHAATAWLDHEGEARDRAEQELRLALASPRKKVMQQFNALPEGVRLLVAMRSDLASWQKDYPDLAPLDEDLLELLSSWFDIGFLEMRRISWDSPASLLEKLIAYEAVHAIRSWSDLRNRLDSDRRCYGFFHPRMPDEPLIFVEIALCHSIADNVQRLLDENQPTSNPVESDTAIFYSISNTQHGLRGISFGNFLIKRVVTELSREFPRLRTFATLSPIPGFVRWLKYQAQENDLTNLLHPAEREALITAFPGTSPEKILTACGKDGKWHQEPAQESVLRTLLPRLAATYLSVGRNGPWAIDPVARFHLGNGARLERINWMGDFSEKGFNQSAGLMVNYLYDLKAIESQHESFIRDGKVSMSSEVKRLLRSLR